MSVDPGVEVARKGMIDLMRGNDGEIDKCHTRSASSFEHLFLSSLSTFTLLPNELSNSGNVSVLLQVFTECLLCMRCCVRCMGRHPVAPWLVLGVLKECREAHRPTDVEVYMTGVITVQLAPEPIHRKHLLHGHL